MKRSGFLKSLITLIAAPSLFGEIEIKPFNEKEPQVFNADNIKFYTSNPNKFMLGDLIVSDMGDKAMVVSIFNNGGNSFIQARPICRNQYRYKKLENVIPINTLIAA